MNNYERYADAMRVIELVAEGRTLTAACRDVRMPYGTFRKLLASSETLRDLYAEAEHQSYDLMAEALLEIETHELYGTQDARMAKVMSDNIKWLLSKRRPKDFGDKVQVEVNVTADRAIVDALERAKHRAIAHAPIIDVTPTAVETVSAIADDGEDYDFLR